jgi:hypothetical protein
VNASVSAQVDTQIAPRLKQLENNAQLSILINLAQAGNGTAYDRLFAMASDPREPKETQPLAIEVVESIIARHSSPLRPSRQFTESKTEAQEVILLHNPEAFTREAALDSLNVDYWKKHLDDLFNIMTTDPSLDVRAGAYFIFAGITQFKSDPLNNSIASQWWVQHRKDFVK